MIDRALTLAPNSPEVHFALGLFFYWGHRQYEKALTELNRTLELQPNNALARQFCAWVYRRRGEWERSLADARRAEELDPRDPIIPLNFGTTYIALRLWKDAEQLRALALDPHSTLAAGLLLIARLNGTGSIDSARRALDGFPDDVKRQANLGSRDAIDVAMMISDWIYLDVIQRRFTDALQAVDKHAMRMLYTFLDRRQI
jgi:tetratricopeptide (TPR) repeat protein